MNDEILQKAINLRNDYETKAATLSSEKRVLATKRAAASALRGELSDETIDRFKDRLKVDEEYGGVHLGRVNREDLTPQEREGYRQYADYLAAENEADCAGTQVDYAREKYDWRNNTAAEHYQENRNTYQEAALKEARADGKVINVTQGPGDIPEAVDVEVLSR